MKSILISIKPEYVKDILNGIKILEIRKTRPNIELPCKVYIYCTNGYVLYDLRNEDYLELKNNFILDVTHKSNKYLSGTPPMLNRKVVAEFTLNEIDILEFRHLGVSHINCYIPVNENADYEWEKHSCINYKDIVDYGKSAPIYALHIEDLKIYDEPKELSEFRKENRCHLANYEYGCCFECCTFYDLKDCDGRCSKLKRPPQSWCYVEGDN